MRNSVTKPSSVGSNVRSSFFLLACLTVFTGFPTLGANATTPNFYAGFRDVPSTVHVYRFQGHPQKIFLFITALPQLYVFNAKGQELLGHTGEYDNPEKVFSKVFLGNTAVTGNETLTQQMRVIVPTDEQANKPASTPSQFTLVEYWASWCEYCFEERDQLLTFFRAHPKISVNWITVDADKK